MSDEAFNLEDTVIEAEEDFVIDAQFLIQELMNEQGLSRADLAKRLGVSKARLTQMMRPDANPTLRSVARVAHALGEKLRLRREPEVVIAKEDALTLIWNEITAHEEEAASVRQVASTKVLRSTRVNRVHVSGSKAELDVNGFCGNDNLWSSPTVSVAA